MIRRDIYKTRVYNDEVVQQSYGFTLRESYLKYRKDTLHKFLRKTFINGVPEVFSVEKVKSASSDRKYIACDSDGVKIYRENKPSDALPYPVIHYPCCTHLFSQMCLESNGFVDKKFRIDVGPTNSNAMFQHQKVQNYYLYSGFAEAIEVPVWGHDKLLTPGQDFTNDNLITGFIDILCYWNGRLFILDYKPQCMQAKNKFAVAQLLKYRDLLHGLTGIEDIGCAYFDERDTIIVDV